MMFPLYDKQSAGGCGTTPRQSDIQCVGTDRRTQHGVWSRPPAAHLAKAPANDVQKND